MARTRKCGSQVTDKSIAERASAFPRGCRARAAEVDGLRGDLRWINNWPQQHPKRMCEKLKQATSLVRCQQPGLVVQRSCVAAGTHSHLHAASPHVTKSQNYKNNKNKLVYYWLF